MRQRIVGARLGTIAFGAALLCGAAIAQEASKPPATYKELPSEVPADFKPTHHGFDHDRRDVMIPMRDGVQLHAVILVPKGARNAPILLTRTPYDANRLTGHAESAHLGPVLNGYDNATDVIVEGGYIRVVEDVRGKYGSEGDYVVNRPLRGPRNPTPVDHATDTYDTIDWLVKNIPETNGKVGILGISYDGFLPLMALVDPHPALKVSVPMNPMVDGWMGDDWFHHGAFRQLNVGWIYDQVATHKGTEKWWISHHDNYDMYMQAGSAGGLARLRGLDRIGFWRKLEEHPSYDAFWQQQAVDKLLAERPLKVPVMLVHSLWDQEDIYGAPAVYKAIEPKDTGNDKVFLAIGPWYHGQVILDGSALGAVKFHADTAWQFRREVLAPFLAQYLKDGAPKADVAPVTAFETGTNTWRRFQAWPPRPGEASKPLYLRAGLKLSFDAPASGDAESDEYASDPSKPVPFRRRPIQPMGYGSGNTWAEWLVDDQREASGRPDVLAYVSDVLTSPVKVAGEPIANLVASTTGTDSDWVVKLIDVYPDEVAGDEDMGGYQLAVAMDIFRGRYRESLETARPIPSGRPLPYRFALPNVNHVFLPGHRIMVQVQSSWFPLYDRNPQAFVPNIFQARPGDYVKATQRVYHAPGHASLVELPIVP
ncbi:Cocaine esterase [Aquisphaera giovannonii]|uniref:Cocaine esterase n=1 Tax=Aquisphaera giovannonii TaxID=406548 RepID=A0A5B9W300_9BACT|nr:CocE/NonD family hydrolase [Aquisphaera giovannonii]QEH34435.1 Cocaine esterase [Aquisphaera giovannonii]